MDFAYDHIQEEIIASSEPTKQQDGSAAENGNLNLGAEFEETFRAFSNSPWGTKIGGLWSNVRKQGESYYEGARQEYAAVSEEATKGFTDLRESIVGRTRGLSLGGALSSITTAKDGDDDAPTPTTATKEGDGDAREDTTTETEEGEGFISRFRTEAAKRLKELEKAEDAADEALIRFGTNVRNFLRDAVSVAPPEEGSDKILFESKDAEGKRVFHATRFEAQLHVIHTNLETLKKDPESEQWTAFKNDFNVDSQTDDITKDLEKYPELRRAMEKLVPESVEYAEFWARYYFLRLAVETEEQKRRELLKGANTAADEEEVGWDEDSDSESENPSTPQVKTNKQGTASSQHLTVTNEPTTKSSEPRNSNDQHSQPDSESSYDLVSGATSQTPASPREKVSSKAEDSDEDWE
ncbi:BSD domain protein [Talaromyces proteolyticus]|uniref:BSD domain protein n=1 Tax=Talaromyces proteolyticus TaxID=1131652 RepID=A0AAD4KDD2_9EURO|nr:BSD domain protein [Talaromyces proteolyticus]KAH8689466.1 BSD domain protein [Talaromyces proteolyticus]